MDYKKVELLQNIWDVITNIIGYSLIAASIILGIRLGYKGSTAFAVFCIAAAVYFFSKYILGQNQRFGFTESKNSHVQHSKVLLEPARFFMDTLETCWAEEGT